MLPELAAIAAGRQDWVEAMSHRLFLMIFVDDRESFGRKEVLAEVRAVGLDVSRFASDLDSRELAEEHRRHIGEAEARGVFGVPTFLCGGRLYWGSDRLVLLEADLKSAK